MFHLIKHLFYLVIVLGIVFAFWFLPKYSYVKDNPGFCAKLTNNLYYCGDQSNLEEVFNNNR